MASNPMQRKTRNAFLLGFLIMLIIAVIIGGIIFVLVNRKNKTQVQEQKQQTMVYVVNSKISSGQEVLTSKLTLKAVDNDLIPANAFGSSNSVAGYIAKIDLPVGTVLSQSMLTESEEMQDSERTVEYNMLQLPIQLDVGEFVDIRFLLSNGQDYIVVSHKEVKDISSDTIWLQLTEDEILLMSNVIVEAAISPATNLYITKYVEPGLQGAASITYVPSGDVINLIANDPNIIQTSRDKLRERYQNYNSLVRSSINNELSKYDVESTRNVESAILEAREKAAQARQEYLYGIN